jgi:hypothetical protein
MIVCGIGLGLVSPTLAQVAVGIVHPRLSGMASGVNTTFRQIGLVIGIAGLGAVFQSEVLGQVTAALKGTQAAYLTPTFANAVSSGGTVAYIEHATQALRPALDHAARVSYTSGLSEILIIAGIVAVIGAVIGWPLVRRRDLFVTQSPPAVGGAPPAGRPLAPAAAGPATPGGAHRPG